MSSVDFIWLLCEQTMLQRKTFNLEVQHLRYDVNLMFFDMLCTRFFPEESAMLAT